MKQITTLKPKEGVELLAIVVDKDACDFWKNKTKQGADLRYTISDGYYGLCIVESDFTILGIVEYNKPIEFDCDELVVKIGYENEFRYFQYVPKGYMVVNAVLARHPFNNSKESFISFLEANNINLQQLDKENKKLIILNKQ